MKVRPATTTQAVQRERARELLLQLIRKGADPAAVRLASTQIDWAEFLRTTSSDLFPYLDHRICALGLDIPGEAAERLHAARRDTAIHNLQLRHQFRRIVTELQRNNIPAMALKGIVLAHSVYPDVSLRPMSDIDLLVKPPDKHAAEEILRDLGYDPKKLVQINAVQRGRLLPNLEHAPTQKHRDSIALVEIHTELECGMPRFPVATDWYWSRAVTAELCNVPVQTLCQEDLLFHLCLHVGWHAFEKGILPLIDIALLIDSRPSWDWEAIAAASIARNCSTWMYLSLLAARDYAGAAVPDTFFALLPKPTELQRLRTLAEEHIWSARPNSTATVNFITRLLLQHSWRDRAMLVARRIQILSAVDVRAHKQTRDWLSLVRMACGRAAQLIKPAARRLPRMWRVGHFRPAAIRDGVRKAETLDELLRLVAENEALLACADGKSGLNHSPWQET